MKTRFFSRFTAMAVCIALILSCFVMGVSTVSALDVGNADAAIAGVKIRRTPIISEVFTSKGKGYFPNDWDKSYAYPFLYKSGTAIDYAYVKTENDASAEAPRMALTYKIGSGHGVHILTMPKLCTENYMVSVKASFRDTSSGSFGIATDINSDYTKATYASILELNAKGTVKTFTRTQISDYYDDRNVTETAFADLGCFDDNAVSVAEEFTLNAYHINDVTYFYCNDVFVGEVADRGNLYCDRIGLYNNAGIASVYSVDVYNLVDSENEIAAVDNARLNKEAAYHNDFSEYSSNTTPDGWIGNFAYPFLYNSSGALGYASTKVWKENDTAINYMSHKTTGGNGGHILTMPALGVENYVFEARVKVMNLQKPIGIVTNIKNDYQSCDSATIMEIKPDENKFKVFSRISSGTSGADDGVITLPFNYDYYFSNDVLSSDNEIILKAYHIDDVTYFYCNDIFVAQIEDYSNEGVRDRVGFYSYNGELKIYEVSVNPIISAETDIEDRVYAIGTIISDDFNSSTDQMLAEQGYSLKTDTWASSGTAGQAVIATKDGHTGIVLSAYSGTGALVLPTLGTSNYVMTAELIIRDANGSFGLLTNIDDPVETSQGATHSILYCKSDEIYQYNRETWNHYDKQTLNQTDILGKLPQWSNRYILKAYSFEGVTYFFVNDVFVASIDQKNPAETSLCGFYVYNCTVLVDSVEVKALSFMSETDILTVEGAKIRYADENGDSNTAAATGIRFMASVDTENAIYNPNAKFGMLVVGSDKLAAGQKLTFDVAAAANIEISNTAQFEASIFNMSKAALNTYYIARAYMIVENGTDKEYYFSKQIKRNPAAVANLFYNDTTYITEDIKSRLDIMFKDCSEYLGAADKAISFVAFSDFHYKEGMYAATVDGLKDIIKRAGENKVDFMMQCGDFSNDTIGSPELTNAYRNNDYSLPVYGVYGNHELESAGNSMAAVTPLLTNNANVVWGTQDGKIGDGSIAYYYADYNGFRLIFLDTNYSWNPAKSIWEHNKTNSYGQPEGNIYINAIGPRQLAWLEEVLLDAASNELSCIVVSHESMSGVLPSVAHDAKVVRELFKKANDIRPKTVLMSINGHQHLDMSTEIDDVVYFNVNTANNGWWSKANEEHYTEEHTFTYVKYDELGNEISRELSSLTELSSHKATYFYEDQLSALVRITKSGNVRIEGMETAWMHGIEPPPLPQYRHPYITSATYGSANTALESN